MGELIVSELIAYAVAVIVVLMVVLVTFLANKIVGILQNWGVDVIEFEVYHVARKMLRTKRAHEEIIQLVLNEVEDRLQDRKIKYSTKEVLDVIENTLEDLEEY